MPAYTTENLHNIALIGSAYSGKTSLTEALLRAGGAIHHLGLVEKGTTMSDFTDEEKARGASIYNSVLHCDYKGARINILDTPGSPDFAGQALSALLAVETAVVVLSASAGLETNARRLFHRAADANVCRMIIINKVDAENADLPALLLSIQDTLGSECLPVNLPADGGKRVVDCLRNNEGESDLGPVAGFHTAIVDQIVEMDDDLMAEYLEKGEIEDLHKLHEPFEKAMREGHLVPICFTTARSHLNAEEAIGVQEFLDFLHDWAPNPMEGRRRKFVHPDGKGEELVVDPNPSKPALAHTFKVVNDRFGRMGVFRMHQGTIAKDSTVYVGDHKKPTKIAHIFTVQGKDHTEIDAAVAGDICAVMKIEEIGLGEVIHSQPNGRLKLNSESYPDPMFGLAIESKKRGDEQKIADALHKIKSEDPTFKMQRNSVTHELVIYGLGEQHLRTILDKMHVKFGLEVDTHPPKIAYKETVSATGEGHHRHKKQSGGAGQFGEVYLRVVPLERGAGFEFVDDTFGGNPPKQYLPAVEKGVRLALETGCIAGFPMQDVRVEVYDGKHHDVDSKEVAFITAGKKAFIDAVSKARPQVLEPVVHIEVTVPSRYMGDITGDLSGKRGRVQGTDMLPGDLAVIKAQVPLAEVASYQNQLKSVTGGQGSYTMEFSHYDPVPGNVQANIVAHYKPHAEED
ncbi:MAG: elongation factor G [Phycisphaeraceae bacterium]